MKKLKNFLILAVCFLFLSGLAACDSQTSSDSEIDYSQEAEDIWTDEEATRISAGDLDFSELIPYDQENADNGRKIVSEPFTVVLGSDFLQNCVYELRVGEMESDLSATSDLYYKLTGQPIENPPEDLEKEGFEVFEKGTVLKGTDGKTAGQYYLNLVLKSDETADMGKKVSFILDIAVIDSSEQ